MCGGLALIVCAALLIVSTSAQTTTAAAAKCTPETFETKKFVFWMNNCCENMTIHTAAVFKLGYWLSAGSNASEWCGDGTAKEEDAPIVTVTTIDSLIKGINSNALGASEIAAANGYVGKFLFSNDASHNAKIGASVHVPGGAVDATFALVLFRDTVARRPHATGRNPRTRVGFEDDAIADWATVRVYDQTMSGTLERAVVVFAAETLASAGDTYVRFFVAPSPPATRFLGKTTTPHYDCFSDNGLVATHTAYDDGYTSLFLSTAAHRTMIVHVLGGDSGWASFVHTYIRSAVARRAAATWNESIVRDEALFSQRRPQFDTLVVVSHDWLSSETTGQSFDYNYGKLAERTISACFDDDWLKEDNEFKWRSYVQNIDRNERKLCFSTERHRNEDVDDVVARMYVGAGSAGIAAVYAATAGYASSAIAIDPIANAARNDAVASEDGRCCQDLWDGIYTRPCDDGETVDPSCCSTATCEGSCCDQLYDGVVPGNMSICGALIALGRCCTPDQTRACCPATARGWNTLCSEYMERDDRLIDLRSVVFSATRSSRPLDAQFSTFDASCGGKYPSSLSASVCANATSDRATHLAFAKAIDTMLDTGMKF